MSTTAPLTAQSSIGEWLNHPEGSALIRDVLGGAAGGFDEAKLAPVRSLPLH